LTNSLIHQSLMPPAIPPPATSPRDASSSAAEAGHSEGRLRSSGRVRSRSPMPFRYHHMLNARYGNANSDRAAARSRATTGRPDRFMNPWRGASPASGTTSTLFPDDPASMPIASSSDKTSQSPSNAAAHMAHRRRRDDIASLEDHPNMHQQLNCTLRNRGGACEALMDLSKPGTPGHQNAFQPSGGLSLNAAMQCAEHPCCNVDKVIKILELPLCLCG
jgi:hypothetical protein